MILIFVAMYGEVQACFGFGAEPKPREVAGHPVFEAGDVAVCQTGLGRRSRDAASAVLPHFKPRAILSAGVAGGLHPDLSSGDIIVCSHLHHAEMRGGTIEDAPVFCDERLTSLALDVAGAAGLHATLGSAVTVDDAAWTPAEKSDLRAWKSHDVVEMESYWIGEVAREADLPYLALRSVSDQAVDALVETPALTPDGEFDIETFQAWIREHPEHAPLLAQQANRNRRGMGALTSLLSAFLPRLAGTQVS
jgi:adenosylhomocysteine nucleosidase